MVYKRESDELREGQDRGSDARTVLKDENELIRQLRMETVGTCCIALTISVISTGTILNSWQTVPDPCRSAERQVLSSLFYR